MSDVDVFTDGACRGNPGPGGWGVLLRAGKRERELWGGEPATTNNRMELTAAIRALEALNRRCHVRTRYFLGANRVLLTEIFTRRVITERIPVHAWSWDWARSWSRREVYRFLPLVRLPDGPFRKWTPDRWEGIKTCNLSAWRNDLIRVNGLDESYEGWGLEDSDVVIRLLHAGVKHKTARFAAPVFHLWHPEQDRMKLSANQKRLDDLLRSTDVRAAVGLDQYGVAASSTHVTHGL